MESIKTDITIDAKGLACPMPIVKTKKAINEITAGQVLEVQATDKGSKADIQAWAKSAGHQYLGTIEEGEILKHYLRKSSNDSTIERKYSNVISNEGLVEKIDANEELVILDVREEAEYAFNHINQAISIPLGELEHRFTDLNKDDAIYVVCRTGNRSDFACQLLVEKGFTNITNVVPGMCDWSSESRKSETAI